MSSEFVLELFKSIASMVMDVVPKEELYKALAEESYKRANAIADEAERLKFGNSDPGSE